MKTFKQFIINENKNVEGLKWGQFYSDLADVIVDDAVGAPTGNSIEKYLTDILHSCVKALKEDLADYNDKDYDNSLQAEELDKAYKKLLNSEIKIIKK